MLPIIVIAGTLFPNERLFLLPLMPTKKPKPKCIYYSQRPLTSAQQQVSGNFPETKGSRCFWKSIKTVYGGKVWVYRVILWRALVFPHRQPDKWRPKWDVSSGAASKKCFLVLNVSILCNCKWKVFRLFVHKQENYTHLTSSFLNC